MLRIRSLRTQLMLIVGLALAPLALASIAQGVLHVRARQAAIDDVLRQTALYATHNEQNVFGNAENFLRNVAQRPELSQGPAQCSATLATAMIGDTTMLDVAFVDSQGGTICAARNSTASVDYTRTAWWKPLQTRTKRIVGHQLYSAVAGKSFLPVALPLHDRTGKFAGALIAALDIRAVSQTSPFGRLPPESLMVIVDGGGSVVASNRAVPAGLSSVIAKIGPDKGQHTFVVDDAGGERWRWAAASIADSKKVIAFAMLEPLPFGVTRIYLIGNILLPILMVILASVAMWLGTERFVIRWTSYLKRVSAAYGQNHFALELSDLEEAPDEFRLLGYEMKDMAISIRDRDRTLSSALQQKTAMAREIHHRIKNNLQIVDSLISLYSRNVAERDAQIAFTHIRARLGALTLIQRLMEMRETNPVIRMCPFFNELAEQFRIIGADAGVRYRVKVESEDWLLSPDMATPISFFVVEALSFELFADRERDTVRDVKLTFSGDGPKFLRLVIEDELLNSATLQTGKPSPERILRALAEQLQGQYWLDQSGSKAKLILRLPEMSGTQSAASFVPSDSIEMN